MANWLNFRMRAMLVSVAAYPLWLHWREVGHWLAREFLDYFGLKSLDDLPDLQETLTQDVSLAEHLDAPVITTFISTSAAESSL